MGTQYTIKVTIGEATVEVSGDDREGLVKTVAELRDVLGIKPRPMLGPGKPDETTASKQETVESEPKLDQASVEDSKPQKPVDARTFFKARSPSTQVEAAAVATFFLTEHVSGGPPADDVGKDELEEVFRLAGRKLPSRTQQLLVDAHKAGYLDRVSQGRYRLSNVGHNLVAHEMKSGSDESDA